MPSAASVRSLGPTTHHPRSHAFPKPSARKGFIQGIIHHRRRLDKASHTSAPAAANMDNIRATIGDLATDYRPAILREEEHGLVEIQEDSAAAGGDSSAVQGLQAGAV